MMVALAGALNVEVSLHGVLVFQVRSVDTY